MIDLHQQVSRLVHFWAIQEQRAQPGDPFTLGPVITFSGLRGCRGAEMAKILAFKTKYRVLEPDLIEYLVRYLGPRCELLEALSLEQRCELDALKHQVLTARVKQPDDYLARLCEVMLAFRFKKRVIIIDSRAGFLLPASEVLRVRLIADRQLRIHHLVTLEEYSREQAIAEIDRRDAERQESVQRYFQADLHQPDNYDLTINLNRTHLNTAVELLRAAAQTQNWGTVPDSPVDSASLSLV